SPSGFASVDACTKPWNATADSDANTPGHRQNGAPAARTTTVMSSTRSKEPSRCEIEHCAPRTAAVARTDPPPHPSPPVKATGRDRASRRAEVGEGEATTVPAARAGICRDEVADATFP